MRSIQTQALLEILKTLNDAHPDSFIITNQVGNLAILIEEEYVGYIDLSDGTIQYLATE